MRRRHILGIGLLLYASSFFLVAVIDLGSWHLDAMGYECALIALGQPWTANALRQGWVLFHDFEYVSLLISGWINPLFLVALALAFSGRHRQAYVILRIVWASMIPFCWIVFLYMRFLPREGHFVWIAGMFLALFSKELGKQEKLDLPAPTNDPLPVNASDTSVPF